jgi:hypothetical protein
VPRSPSLRLLALTALAVALTVPAAGHATPGYTIEGLKIRPPIGSFGGIRLGSCDLITYAGCEIRTFTVENVGSDPILIGGFGIFDLDPSTAALLPGTPGSGCEFLPIVGGYWSLQPGASCTIGVAFSPTQKGPMKNELRIWFNDQSSPIAIVKLVGVGT